MQKKTNNNEIAIYIHYPFCEKKCPYCNFYSIAQNNQYSTNFGKALLQEIKNNLTTMENKQIISVFFGGGTPSLINSVDIASILQILSPMLKKHSEITLEANPSSLDKNKMQELKNGGINRISIGVQSFNNDNLKFLGRIHSSHQAITVVEEANSIFDNVSFDIMFALPSQTINNLQQDLQIAKNLLKNHLSIYELTIEKNTPFYNKNIIPATENIASQMYRAIQTFMKEQGFNQYEVSNYALEGYESLHNQNYWLGGQYLGIGPSAHGRVLTNNQWIETIQTKNIKQFMQNSFAQKNNFSTQNHLTKEERELEIMLTMLRTNNWISINTLKKEKLQYLQSQGLIELGEEQFKISQKGMGLNDYITNFLMI